MFWINELIPSKQMARTKENEVDRRSKSDRRTFDLATQFPVINHDGKLVKQDRRSRPDRRIAKSERGQILKIIIFLYLIVLYFLYTNFDRLWP